MTRKLSLAAALAPLLLAAGCADKGVQKTTIRGTASYHGEPLQSGILRFVGAAGDFSMAPIQPDGTFIMTDVVPGEVKVGYTEGPRGSGDSSGKKAGKATRVVSLPAKYHDPEKSGVKYTITATTTELNVDFPK